MTQIEIDELWEIGYTARRAIQTLWSASNNLAKKNDVDIKFWLDKIQKTEEDLEDTVLKLTDELERK